MKRLLFLTLLFFAAIPLQSMGSSASEASNPFAAASSATDSNEGSPDSEASNPFADGIYIGQALPVPVTEVDYATANQSISEKPLSLCLLSVGGSGFASVALGLYGDGGESTPLWFSGTKKPLPFIVDKVNFEDIYLKYTYLPGDKYVSSNIKLAAGENGRSSEALRFFRVGADTSLAGFQLLADDIIVASDSAGNGSLSHKGNSDFSDMVLVLRPDKASVASPGLLLAIGGGGFFSLTWWLLRPPKQSMQKLAGGQV